MNKKNSYLINILTFTLFLGIGISKILITSSYDTFISCIIGSIIGSIIIYFINKKNNTNSILYYLLIYILFIIGLLEFINLISNIYLIDTNKFFILIPFISIIIYLNSKSTNINLKVCKILFYITIILYFISLISLIPLIKPLNYLPIFTTNIGKIIKSSILYALYTTTPNIIYKGLNINISNKQLIKSYLISNIILITIFLTIEGVLGINIIKLFKYPEYIVLKKIKLLDFINNIENILSFIWIYIIFIETNLCSKILYNKFKNKKLYIILVFINFYIITKYIYNNVIILLYIYKYLEYICIIILILYFINIKKR